MPKKIRRVVMHMVWVNLTLTLRRDDAGKEHVIHARDDDIEALKNAEQALRESEIRMRALLDASQDEILLVSTDGTVLAINKAARARLAKRIADSDPIGARLDQLLPKISLVGHGQQLPKRLGRPAQPDQWTSPGRTSVPPRRRRASSHRMSNRSRLSTPIVASTCSGWCGRPSRRLATSRMASRLPSTACSVILSFVQRFGRSLHKACLGIEEKCAKSLNEEWHGENRRKSRLRKRRDPPAGADGRGSMTVPIAPSPGWGNNTILTEN